MRLVMSRSLSLNRVESLTHPLYSGLAEPHRLRQAGAHRRLARLMEPFQGVWRRSGMRRSVAIGVVLAGVLAGCGRAATHDLSPSSDPRGPITVRLRPGHYRFHLGEQVVIGDKIACVTRHGDPAGGGYVG